MPKDRPGTSLPSTIGGVIAGFDYDVMRTLPPPHELVRKGAPVRGVSGEPGDLTVELPGAPDGPLDAEPWPLPRAVLLDLDGLAIDSEPIHNEATRRALASFGIAFDLALIGPFYGQPTEVSTRAIAALHGIDPGTLFARRTGEFEALIEAGVPFRPGLVEACDLLEGSGLRLGLVSSGLGRYVTQASRAMAAAGIRLDAVISVEDVEHPKPHPDPYLRAAERLGIAPRACVAFEDAPAGVRSAADAGMRCVAIPNEHTSDGDFERASVVVPDLLAAARWVLALVAPR